MEYYGPCLSICCGDEEEEVSCNWALMRHTRAAEEEMTAECYWAGTLSKHTHTEGGTDIGALIQSLGVGGRCKGGARCLSEEAPLIKAFSTGGRVLQEHRDAPAGWRDGIEQQLEDTLGARHREGERNPQQDSGKHYLCPPSD
ncbi:hypothetical protein CRENBAI_010093 [Crenichthys baileyi]|uniref:Uncharacterized protein n=1 Tax=Crenichthys baileyi TaxID=28760 RepID=A0AAV9RYX4_9TELE